MPVENSNPEDGYSYYEQLRTPYGTFKIGNAIYLLTSYQQLHMLYGMFSICSQDIYFHELLYSLLVQYVVFMI